MGVTHYAGFLYVRKDGGCWTQSHLAWADWKNLALIYDLRTSMYVNRELWRRSEDEPDWAIPEASYDV